MTWYIQETSTLPAVHTDLDVALALAKQMAEETGINYSVLELVGEQRLKARESEYVSKA